MQVFWIKRWDMSQLDTLGSIRDEYGNFRCLTLERPWKNNQSDISCIPKGEYLAKLNTGSHFHYPVWQLQDVPGRTAIEIHPANIVRELLGCIALGLSLHHFSKPDEAIEESKAAFDDFMELTKNEQAIKIIIDEV